MVDIERVVTLDELMECVPPELVRDAESRRVEAKNSVVDKETESDSSMSKDLSKAKRIRAYMESHPEARNKDVVEALGSYGVTAADVANVKSLAKRTGDPLVKPAKSKEVAAKAPSASAGETRSEQAKGPNITWQELDAGVAFVKAAGSVQRAQHLLIIIEQIKAC